MSIVINVLGFATLKWSLILVLGILFGYYLVTTWNEEAEKFVVEL
ncbi:MAG: hypothetical protein WBI57_01005 [Desulfobacterales bacterium]